MGFVPRFFEVEIKRYIWLGILSPVSQVKLYLSNLL